MRQRGGNSICSVSVLQCSDVSKVDEARKLRKGIIDLEVLESPLKILR